MSSAAESLLRLLGEAGLTLGVAESLTGGAVAAEIVSVPGASAVFRGGVVAYAADVKVGLLGVDAALVERVGTVDEGVALALAEGARTVLGCDLALATTGVAGPGPSEGHDAGTVFVAAVGPWGRQVERLSLTGDRDAVRRGATRAALDLGVALASSAPAGSVDHARTTTDETVHGEEGAR